MASRALHHIGARRMRPGGDGASTAPYDNNTEYPRDRGVMAEIEAAARRGMGTGVDRGSQSGLCHKFPQGCWHQQRDMGPAARSTSRTGLALDPFRDTVAKTPLR